VFIGGQTEQIEDIVPEVPDWLHNTILGIGFGSAVILAGPVLAVLGLAGGMVAGKIGYQKGGELFGEGSDGQKLMALGSAIIGGAIMGGGGKWFNARHQIKVEGLGSNFGNLRTVRQPSSVVSAIQLRAKLVSEEIANGHAFEKHVIQQAEYKNLGITTRAQFAEYIESIITNPTATKNLVRDRTAFWDEASGTIVIRDPKSLDGGTAFRPKTGRKYFDNLESE